MLMTIFLALQISAPAQTGQVLTRMAHPRVKVVTRLDGMARGNSDRIAVTFEGSAKPVLGFGFPQADGFTYFRLDGMPYVLAIGKNTFQLRSGSTVVDAGVFQEAK